MIPTLTTDRLRLVPPTEAHLPGETAFFTSDRARFVGGPVPAHRVWRLLAIHRGHWDLRGYGTWAVELHDGTHIGMCGIWHPGEWPEPEIGYHLYEGTEGRGYATEAATCARTYAFEKLDMPRIASFIAPSNTASQSVARRMGGHPSGEVFRAAPEDAGVDIWRYERGTA